ncbi:NACHT domain-containing protein [Nonomuraea sp. NPDC049141]|uniref:NACHT domain-containing protein n=1 Tax=Nonomuraea sp. NPDC049141 TaxID=3155500 RepID=UPI0033F0A61F
MIGQGRGWRILLATLSIISVAALVVAVWRAYTPGEAVNLADVAAVTLAAATTIGAVGIWSRRPPTEAMPTEADIDTAARVLAGLVERQWRAEARHRLLDDPDPIPVQWQLIKNKSVMSHPYLIAPETFTFTGGTSDIAELARRFRALKRGRLVITGAAGMGKTTLAVQLLLQLLSTRRADQADHAEASAPVPVLLPVSGWDITLYPRLHEWLAARLVQDYPALAAPQLVRGAAALVQDGHVLPILDGLDEIPGQSRPKIINALNDSLTHRDQLIITSRTTEFTSAITQNGRPLNAALVIEPKALTRDAAAHYLTTCLPGSLPPAWEKVLAALRSGALRGLTQLAATPLGLWQIRTVYQAPGAGPTSLTGPLGAHPSPGR